MPNQYQKIDDHTLGVIVTTPQKVQEQARYDYGFLKKQMIAIQLKKDADTAARDAELAELTALIAAADSLGIVATK